MTDWANHSERNKALVAGFVADIWNARRFDRLADYVAEDYVQHNPALGDGRAALAAFLAGPYATTMPQGEFAIARLLAEDDLVVAHSLFRRNEADRGMAVVDIYRVRDGKLAEHWDVKEALPERSASGHPVV